MTKLFDYAEFVEGWDLKINRYATQKVEFGAPGVAEKVAEIEALLQQKIAELDALPNDPQLAKAEPDDLVAIKALRPPGSRRLLTSLPEGFRDKLEGAWLARCAGCTLGSIVEGWKVDRMEAWAAYLGRPLPAGGLLEPGRTAASASLEDECAPRLHAREDGRRPIR